MIRSLRRVVILLIISVGCGGGPGMVPVGVMVPIPCSPSQVVLDGLNYSTPYYGLTVVGEDLFFAWRQNGAPPTRIDRIHRDGTGRTTLYTSESGRFVRWLQSSSSDLYFLEESGDIVPKASLYRLPASGGAATKVGTAEWEQARLFAVVGGYAYLTVLLNQPVGAQFERVNLASGEVTVFAKITGTGVPQKTQIVGSELFFAAGQAGAGSTLLPAVYRVSTEGVMASPTSLGTVGGQDCLLPIGGLFVTPTKMVCGLGGVVTFDHNGVSPAVLIAKDPTHLTTVVAAEGESLYYAERSGPRDDVALSRLSSSDSTLSPIACTRKISYEYVDGLLQDQTRYQVAFSPSEIFWFEERFDGRNMAISLRRANK